MPQRPLIGLIGKQRVGKDTFATVLIEQHGFTRVAFADPLRDVALSIDPLMPSPNGPRLLTAVIAEDGWEGAKETTPEVRTLLQTLGSSMRGIRESIWLDAALVAAAAVPGPVVITDVRYKNEADAIRDAHGLLIRITRPTARPGIGTEHPSETDLDDYPAHLTVANDSTIEEFQARAAALGRLTR